MRIRKKRICSLAYADDMVVLAEQEEEMEKGGRVFRGKEVTGKCGKDKNDEIQKMRSEI